ncbi:hypothetical protein [Arthrobacter sp. JCM 19049]|uniref:hypothetical protein n=1 Tax=Arthrobacter sp. JCM 19049 TaxID=1460643 RepID=UPI00243662E7|nr:hypothetical protein [Arthrobacter sp. JCM 19049]
MSRQEFVRHALNPWVWAEHVNDQLIPAGTELEVVGLSGWDCRPVPVDSDPVSTLGSPQGRLALYPHRVSEVLRRNRRTVAGGRGAMCPWNRWCGRGNRARNWTASL